MLCSIKSISPEPSYWAAGEQQGPGHWEQQPQEQEEQLQELGRGQQLREQERAWGQQLRGQEREGAGQRPWGRSEEERRRILGEASSLLTFQKLTQVSLYFTRI